jgi:hypothetical protein
MPQGEGSGTRTPYNLLRLSIGLEHYDDLIGYLDQALAQELPEKERSKDWKRRHYDDQKESKPEGAPQDSRRELQARFLFVFHSCISSNEAVEQRGALAVNTSPQPLQRSRSISNTAASSGACPTMRRR